MSVALIYKLAGGKIGLNPDVQQNRLVLERFLNEAAEEIWWESDLIGSLMEQVMRVNGNQTISLPSYIGEIRGVREAYSRIPWSINQLRPRYNVSNWQDNWRNWRLVGLRALQNTIINHSVVSVVIPSVADVESPPITVSITGSTINATLITETVTVSALSQQTVNQFLDITSVTKSKITTYDVQLTDVDGRLLTTIPNNELEAQYNIVDISTMPWWSTVVSSQDNYVEVLFKKNLPYLSQDGDVFPAPKCERIVANKIIQIWCQENGKDEKALLLDKLTDRSIARKTENTNRATQDKVSFVPNPQDTLLPRIRSRRYGRYGGYGSIANYGGI